jgi:hypothetical protein
MAGTRWCGEPPVRQPPRAAGSPMLGVAVQRGQRRRRLCDPGPDTAHPVDGDPRGVAARHVRRRVAVVGGADQRGEAGSSALDDRGRAVNHQIELERRMRAAPSPVLWRSSTRSYAARRARSTRLLPDEHQGEAWPSAPRTLVRDLGRCSDSRRRNAVEDWRPSPPISTPISRRERLPSSRRRDLAVGDGCGAAGCVCLSGRDRAVGAPAEAPAGHAGEYAGRAHLPCCGTSRCARTCRDRGRRRTSASPRLPGRRRRV